MDAPLTPTRKKKKASSSTKEPGGRSPKRTTKKNTGTTSLSTAGQESLTLTPTKKKKKKKPPLASPKTQLPGRGIQRQTTESKTSLSEQIASSGQTKKKKKKKKTTSTQAKASSSSSSTSGGGFFSGLFGGLLQSSSQRTLDSVDRVEPEYIARSRGTGPAPKRGLYRTYSSDSAREAIQQFQRELIITGELQTPGFRDKFWAILFWGHIVTLISISVLFSLEVFPLADGGSGSNRLGRMLQEGGNSEQLDEDVEWRDAMFFMTNLLVGLVLAPILTLISLSVMADNAQVMIQVSLIAGIVLSLILLVFCAIMAPISAIFPGILVVIFVVYTNLVWNKIPFAAVMLKTAIAALRANSGVTTMSILVVPITIAYFLFWIDVTVMISDSQWLANQPEFVGPIVVTLLLLSLYWTLHTIYGVVHTTIAGAVGAWWYIPTDVNYVVGCCSTSLRGALSRSMTYSFGSVCLGSLGVTTVELLRGAFFSVATRKRNSHLRSAARSILGCFQGILESFNRYAFVYVALYGYSFREAGRSVMLLFKSRGFLYVINDTLVHRVLTTNALVIGLLTGLIAADLALMFVTTDTNMIILAAFVSLFIGWFMSTLVLSGLHSSVDTIVVLYAEATREFGDNHPELADQMDEAWEKNYPELFQDPEDVDEEAISFV